MVYAKTQKNKQQKKWSIPSLRMYLCSVRSDESHIIMKDDINAAYGLNESNRSVKYINGAHNDEKKAGVILNIIYWVLWNEKKQY